MGAVSGNIRGENNAELSGRLAEADLKSTKPVPRQVTKEYLETLVEFLGIDEDTVSMTAAGDTGQQGE